MDFLKSFVLIIHKPATIIRKPQKTIAISSRLILPELPITFPVILFDIVNMTNKPVRMIKVEPII